MRLASLFQPSDCRDGRHDDGLPAPFKAARDGDVTTFLRVTGSRQADLIRAAAEAGIAVTRANLSTMTSGSRPVPAGLRAVMMDVALEQAGLALWFGPGPRAAAAAPDAEIAARLAAAVAEHARTAVDRPPPRVFSERELSAGQRAMLDRIEAWWRGCPRDGAFGPGTCARVEGFAGTGKSTLILPMLARLGLDLRDVLFCAPTGKASLVMREKGLAGARTIHKIFFRPVGQHLGPSAPDLLFEERDEAEGADAAKLVVVDEFTMVTEAMGAPFRKLGLPVLGFGDPMQLPPVEGACWFDGFPVLGTLTEVHRQAESSPILVAATRIRELAPIPEAAAGRARTGPPRIASTDLLAAVEAAADADRLTVGGTVSECAGLARHDVVLVRRNATRRVMNDRVRRELGHDEPLPTRPGARLVVDLNNHAADVWNGQRIELVGQGRVLPWPEIRARLAATRKTAAGRGGRAAERAAELASGEAEFERHLTAVNDRLAAFAVEGVWRAVDDPRRAPFRAAVASVSFLEDAGEIHGAPDSYWRLAGELGLLVASWGYALTVHKAQASGWDDVCVVEEDSDDPRWLYTALTRAAQRLEVVLHDDHPRALERSGWSQMEARDVELGARVRYRAWEGMTEGVVVNIGKEAFTVRLDDGRAKTPKKRSHTYFGKLETAEQRARNLADAKGRKAARWS